MDTADRIKYNNKILDIIKEYLCKHPDMRFIQALWALGIIDTMYRSIAGHDVPIIIDRFSEEPNKTLERIANKGL